MIIYVKVDANNTKEISDIYTELKCLENEYPGFSEWFNTKVVPGLGKKRDICIAKNGDKIAGVLITKNDEEKKICTLRVSDAFRKHGIGDILVGQSFKILNTTSPIITISEKHIEEFKGLLDRYDFRLVKAYNGYYNCGKLEFSYNGII